MSSDESDAFDDSPIPSKKRRLSPPSPIFDDADSDFSSFNDPPAQTSNRKKRASTSTRTSKGELGMVYNRLPA